MAREKKCSDCNTSFSCGDTLNSSCWCKEYPPIFEVSAKQDCLCPNCLHTQSLIKIDEYVSKIKTSGIKHNLAKKFSNLSGSLIPQLDFYIENNNWVFTEWYHLKRGYCCNNNCRHCPYKPIL